MRPDAFAVTRNKAMSEPVDQNKKITRALCIAMIVATVVCLLAAAVCVYDAREAYSNSGLSAAGPHLLMLLGAVLAILWLWITHSRLWLADQSLAAGQEMEGRLGRLESLLEDMAKSARREADLAALSDQSKALLYRDREIEAFREAIHEDVMRQDYRSAAALIDTIEKRLGYVEEAARLREEVEAGRKATLQERINHAIARIEKHIEAKDWARATRESQRLAHLFPENSKIASLPEHIEGGRIHTKRDLLQAYGEAVRKNDVDRGIELLRELDHYLTPQEAAALEESARGVFRAKLHMLGVQFAIKVTESQWVEAVTVGEEIIREFPNTRMTQEVRQKMDSLKAKAAAATAPSA